MHEELKAIRESLNLELIREEKHQWVTVKGKGVSASYYEVNKPGSKLIKRCFAEIDGYNFGTTGDSGERPYWKKNGRGRMKNDGEVWDKLYSLDDYILNECGYHLW